MTPPSTGTAARTGPVGVDGVVAVGGADSTSGGVESTVSGTLSLVTASAAVEGGAVSADWEPEPELELLPPVERDEAVDGWVGATEPDGDAGNGAGGATDGTVEVGTEGAGVGVGAGVGGAGSRKRMMKLTMRVCSTKRCGNGT